MQVVPKQLLINNPTAQQRVDGYCNNLVNLLEALYKINESIAVWPFMEPTACESDLLTSLLSLGHTITQLTKYFYSLKIKNDFPLLHFHPSGLFNGFQRFMENVQVMFVDFKATIYKCTLQAKQVTCLGWFLSSLEDMCLPTLKKLLQESILSCQR